MPVYDCQNRTSHREGGRYIGFRQRKQDLDRRTNLLHRTGDARGARLVIEQKHGKGDLYTGNFAERGAGGDEPGLRAGERRSKRKVVCTPMCTRLYPPKDAAYALPICDEHQNLKRFSQIR